MPRAHSPRGGGGGAQELLSPAILHPLCWVIRCRVSSHRLLGVPVVERNASYNADGYSLGRMVAGRCLCLLELDGRGCLAVAAWAEWLSFVACDCFGVVVACRCTWLLGVNGYLSSPVAAWAEWLLVVACGCLG